MNLLIDIILIILCYLIGALPTAYIFLLKKNNKKITEFGSGNVGARNFYEITNSKKNALIVLFIDFIKGFLPIFVLTKLGFLDYRIFIFGIAIILGHNYSIFIKFKGGKGFASASGVYSIIFPFAIFIWLLLYFISSRMLTKDINLASLIATIGLPIFILSTPQFVIMSLIKLLFIFNISYFEFILFNLIIALIITLKHLNSIITKLQETFKSKRG